MKKVFLSIAAVSLLSVACGDGRDVEAEDVHEVVDQTTETTVEYIKADENSKVHWFASHLGGLEPHNGYFKLSAASVKVTDNKVTNGSFTIDINTLTNLDIENEEYKGKLEGHLKSADFFNAEKNPTALFEITAVTAKEGDFNHEITGNLTLKDSTRGVTFNANVTIDENTVSLKSEKFNIDRTQWGMHYGAEGTPNLTEDKVISNSVGIELDITLTK